MSPASGDFGLKTDRNTVHGQAVFFSPHRKRKALQRKTAPEGSGAVCSLAVRRGSEVLAALVGRADIVEKLGDLEIRLGFGFGGQFLDRLASGL